jgi:hypothetical protein
MNRTLFAAAFGPAMVAGDFLAPRDVSSTEVTTTVAPGTTTESSTTVAPASTTVASTTVAPGSTTQVTTSGDRTLAPAARPMPHGLVYHTHFPLSSELNDKTDRFDFAGEHAEDPMVKLHLSNIAAGVLLSHMIDKKYGIKPDQTDKEFIYGSVWGQLFQESGGDMKNEWLSKNFIDSEKARVALLGLGQGGPYQINDYSIRMPGQKKDADTPMSGYGLINYAVLQKTLGFTIEAQDSQHQKLKVDKNPDSLDYVDVGPLAAVFFHFNSINRLDATYANNYMKDSFEAKDWIKCKQNHLDGKTNILDLILQVAYNEGTRGGFFYTVLKACADANNEVIASLRDFGLKDNFETADGKPTVVTEFIQNGIETRNWPTSSDSYFRYPRQVHFYIDQLFNNKEDLTKRHADFDVQNDKAVKFTMKLLGEIFVQTMGKLSYIDQTKSTDAPLGTYKVFDMDAVKKAINFDSLDTKELYFSNLEDREAMYTKLHGFYETLEKDFHMSFHETTESDFKEGPVPKPVIPTRVYCKKSPTANYCYGAWGKCKCTKDGKIDCPAGKWHDQCSEGGAYECACSKTPPVDPAKDPKTKHDDYAQCYAVAPLCSNPKSSCVDGTGAKCADGSTYCQCSPQTN